MAARRSHVPINIGLLLHQAQLRATIALNDALQPMQLNNRHFGVLLVMVRDEIDNQRDLVARLITDRSGMVRVIDDLEAMGLLRREPSTVDRRMNILHLTAEGRDAFRKAERLTQSVVDSVFDMLTPEEVSAFEQTLRRIAAIEPGAPAAGEDVR